MSTPAEKENAPSIPPRPKSNSYATGAQLPPMLNRSLSARKPSFVEGGPLPSPSLGKRRGSVFSDFSTDDGRGSMRSSTDNLLRTSSRRGAVDDGADIEFSHWHSAPLALAILPAIAGVLFKEGGTVVTDVMLLCLAAMFLNWCVRAPWTWYYSSLTLRAQDTDAHYPVHFTSPMEDITEEPADESAITDSETKPSDSSVYEDARSKRSAHDEHAQEAAEELRRNELTALTLCFLGPLLGAYLLHTIRGQLSRPSEGLVSNFNLTIFILAAELRPFSHLINLQYDRVAHLQHVVRFDPTFQPPGALPPELDNRLSTLESRISDLSTPTTAAPTLTDQQLSKLSRLSSDLDSLTRAIRTYEKRDRARTLQIDGRFRDLEARLEDALALAGAAARSSQKPGVVALGLEWAGRAFSVPLGVMWGVTVLPLRAAVEVLGRIRLWVFGGTKVVRRKKENGGVNGAKMVARKERR
ncbi:hypothetical protein H2201_004882 [Coniosporium apollinis]|uniref:Uncharacterized protein n=1 Tax=Coniosporium apollinis TaxID=61459 RepID=A0ABQ9NY14_9PEZI|nr:hypothetical protein H2201_004882 [Coniosporium apollinis]